MKEGGEGRKEGEERMYERGGGKSGRGMGVKLVCEKIMIDKDFFFCFIFCFYFLFS